MADNSNISWTDHTFNPWLGCQKVSHECDHCYADALTSGRMGLEVFGGKNKRKRTSTTLWKRPAKWNRESLEAVKAGGRPLRVFCASLADVFEDAPGPNEWRDDVWAIIRATPWLDYQLLTKRPELIASMLPEDWGHGWPNVWLGTSIGHRETVERAPILAAVPAIVHFISYEPAIGPVFYPCTDAIPDVARIAQPRIRWADDFDGPELDLDGIEWLIAGGESGPGHRAMDLTWAQDARDACLQQSWRCADCQCMNSPDEGFCYRCGAGGPEDHMGNIAGRTAFFFKQVSAARPGQGEDALGQVWHEFPASWDRDDVATHPVYAEGAGVA